MNDGVNRSLLHKMKCGDDTIIKIIKDSTKDFETWCPFHHKEVPDALMCYRSFGGVNELLSILEKVYLIFVYLEVDTSGGSKQLRGIIDDIKIPEENIRVDLFRKNIERLLEFLAFYKKRIYEKIAFLTCEESERLDEAIDCFENYCFYSTVVMAVSAVEARLHYLIKQKNKSLYKGENFEKATLGMIIKIFDKSNNNPKFDSIRNLIAEEHKPLIDLLNIYRVYSAHPKAKDITQNIARSILTLSFVFLLDEKHKIKKVYLNHFKGNLKKVNTSATPNQ